MLVISRMIACDFIFRLPWSVFLRAAFPRLSLWKYIARVWVFRFVGLFFLKIYYVKVLNDLAAISWALVLPCARLMFIHLPAGLMVFVLMFIADVYPG